MDPERIIALAAAAGLLFSGWENSLGVLPVSAAAVIASCRPEDGRRDVVIAMDEDRLIPRANSAWLELAIDCGLWGEGNGEFLLGVDLGDDEAKPVLRWAKVRLSVEWDLVGAGAGSGLLGPRACWPEFVMMSLDGEVVLMGTVWGGGDSIGFLAISGASGVKEVRNYVEYMVTRKNADPSTRESARRWLLGHPAE